MVKVGRENMLGKSRKIKVATNSERKIRENYS